MMAVVTYATDGFPGADISADVSRRYCAQHGYDFLFSSTPEFPDRHPQLNKAAMVARAVREYDAVLALDADAVIVNPSIRIEQFLDNDISCTGKFIATGAMVVRCPDRVRAAFIDVLEAVSGSVPEFADEIRDSVIVTEVLRRHGIGPTLYPPTVFAGQFWVINGDVRNNLTEQTFTAHFFHRTRETHPQWKKWMRMVSND